MKFKKNEVDYILMQKMKSNRESFLATITSNIASQQHTLDEFIKGMNECDNKHLPNTKVVWNLSAFVNIISIDLKIIARDLVLEEDDWIQRHYIRQAYLLIYEFYNTYYKGQKEYYVLINEKLNINELNSQKEKVISHLKTYKKTNEDTFKALRNATIAHRDKNVMLQIKMIENLNYSEAIAIINEFDSILNEIGEFMHGVIKIGMENLSKLL